MKLTAYGVLRNEGMTVGNFRDSYRPERHYMRGPGPKWHARHAEVPEPAMRSSQPGLPLSIWLVPIASAAFLALLAVAALA